MNGELENLEFTLTKDMIEKLLIINSLKEKYNKIECNSYISKRKKEMELQKITNDISKCKKSFILLFQNNNSKEIEEYINITRKEEI